MRKKEVFFMNENHKKTKRNYIERMINSKIKCMREAKKYERNYWDGLENMDMVVTSIFLVDGRK